MSENDQTVDIQSPIAAGSPFPDGYDIVGERESLKDLIDSDQVDPTDPRYPRLVELENREAALSKMRVAHKSREGANTEVTDREALGLRDMGKLAVANDESDSVDIHTMHAARLFLGRETKPGENGYAMTGGRRVASALRAIWHLSSKDNPYADYALILSDERMDEVRREIDKRIKNMQRDLERYESQGLNFHVLKNPKPYRVELGFRSPYGYSVIMLINRFDYYVRMVKTMAAKSIIGDSEGRSKIYELTKQCRSIFEEVVNFHRILMRPQLVELSRSDFLPTAQDDGKKRVTAVVKLLGEVPREVFKGQIVPRHSRRRIQLSPQELRLLDEVPLNGDMPVAEESTLL